MIGGRTDGSGAASGLSGTTLLQGSPEARLAAIVDLVHDAIVCCNQDGIVVLFNQGAVRTFGFQPGDVLGRPLEMLLPGEAAVRHRDLVEAFAASGEVSRRMGQRSEIRGRRRDGSEFPARASISRIATDSGVLFVAIVQDVTSEQRTTEELRRSQTMLARAQEIAHMGSWEWDIVTGDLAWSDEVYRIFGLAPQRFAATYAAFLEFVHPEDRDALERAVEAAVRDGAPYDIYHRVVRPAGGVRTVHEQGEVTYDGGVPVRMIGTVHDVTEQQRAVEELESRELFVRSVLDSMSAQTAVLGRDGRILAVNRAWRDAAAAHGSVRGDEVGQHYVSVAWTANGPCEPDSMAQAAAGIEAVLNGRRARFEIDYPARGCEAGGGARRWFTLAVEDLALSTGGAVVSHWDITDRKRAEELLAHQALHDPLTGLPNRALVTDRISHALAHLGRDDGCVGVLFCDLDQFKVVNDSLGHAAGDELLVQAAQRLREAVRPGDTVARFGGDEFVVLCDGLRSPTDAGLVARRVLDAFSYPFVIAERELHIAASIGVAVSDEDSADAGALVRNADTAMYRAKEQGGRRFVFFDGGLRVRAVRRLEIEQDLRQAIDRNELVLHYQPQFDLVTGEIVGVEALVRWQRASGLVPPSDFIPIAEETGLIVPIGAWVLHDACEQYAAWSDASAGALTMSVNVSARQLTEPGLVAMVAHALERTGVPAQRLCIEITETAVMQDVDLARSVLVSLADLGVQIALDDFGTGHASLGYLGRFPVSCLKIDRSFIDGLTHDRAAGAIVASVMALATPLGLDVVAEGVETDEQLDLVRRAGCRYAQGYLLARPLPAVAVRDLLTVRCATAPGSRGS